MPALTRWYLKTSFLYLVLGLTVGVVLAAAPIFRLPETGLFPVYFHLLAIGWLTSLIFGVIFWMFPKYSLQAPRRSETLGWIVFCLMNLGLLFRAIGEPLNAASPNNGWGWLLVPSAILQWMAAVGFVINTWGRIKEK